LLAAARASLLESKFARWCPIGRDKQISDGRGGDAKTSGIDMGVICGRWGVIRGVIRRLRMGNKQRKNEKCFFLQLSSIRALSESESP
jgi:hypothetical protein